jgi:hypothetical protein
VCVLDWMRDNPWIVSTFGGASIVIFVISLLVMPAIAVRIRADYFDRETRPPSPWADQHRLIQAILHAGKNILGCVLVLAGIAMLVLPGQGLLTLLIGFLMLDFPGKYRFEKWLVRRRLVARPINWCRRRAGREQLQLSD